MPSKKADTKPLRSKDKYEAEIRRLKKQLGQARKQIQHLESTHISAEDIEQFVAEQMASGELQFEIPLEDAPPPAPVERCKRCAKADVEVSHVGIWKIVECRSCGSRRRDQTEE